MKAAQYTPIQDDNTENDHGFLGFGLLSYLPIDARLLYWCKIFRMVSFGFLSVMLVEYLKSLNLNEGKIGLLFTLTLAGDMLVSILLTSHADRWGRRTTLLLGAALSFVTGVIFATQRSFWVLLISAIVGVISPSGNECGPFMAIEISALSQVTQPRHRTHLLAWYNLFGCFAAAFGALFCGFAIDIMIRSMNIAVLDAYRIVMTAYALCHVVKLLLFYNLSSRVEVPHVETPPLGSNPVKQFFGLHKSQAIVAKLSVLFTMDSFAGAFLLQSLVAAWFVSRWNTPLQLVGTTVFLCNIVAGISALFAATLADHIGLILTMVVTHLPSNVIIMLVPAMPTEFLAIAVYCIRNSISQMDVPTRNAYVQGVVDPDERSAANGITNVVRSLGASAAPVLAESLFSNPATASYPFVIGGGLKIVYDLLLLWSFSSVKPEEEIAKEALRDRDSTSKI